VKYNLLGFSSDVDYDAWIAGTLLPHCEAIIEDYCGQPFSDASVSGGLKTVCVMLASRTLQHMIVNAHGPITSVADLQVRSARRGVFSQDLKNLLGPHVKSRHNLRSPEYQKDDVKDAWNE
jgi:hypothetical protein